MIYCETNAGQLGTRQKLCYQLVSITFLNVLTQAKGQASVYFLAEYYIVVQAYAYDIEMQTHLGQFGFYRDITSFILRIGVSFLVDINIHNNTNHAFSIQNRILS